MRFLIPTGLILIGLATNHAVHGTGCWGLQPGGRTSANLFMIQALISFLALVYSLYRTLQSPIKFNIIFLITACTASLFACLHFWLVGSRLFTSIHNQGIENLPTFLAASAVAIIIGVQIFCTPAPPIRLGSDCPACGYPLKQLPKPICPECGHESVLK